MLAEAHRLERLVGDLLDLARLDARDFRVDLAPVDLAALARAAGRGLARTVRARSASQFRLEATPARTVTDAARLRQVLDGLMENALRVTPAGAPIVLAVRTDPDGWAVAEVRDGGPGLTPDDLAVAFVRGALYERYRGVRQVGTGFGLAIVHGLVTRLGGTVDAGSAPEGGARFTVRVPPPSAVDQRLTPSTISRAVAGSCARRSSLPTTATVSPVCTAEIVLGAALAVRALAHLVLSLRRRTSRGSRPTRAR